MKAVKDSRPGVPGTRERLLRAGLALARKGGLRSITVRSLATRARANPGSFVYHFGTRAAFLAELLEQWYAPLMGQLKLHADAEADPLQAVRALVLQLLQWTHSNAPFVAELVRDAAAGEAAARQFFAGLQARHPALLLAAIARAQQAGQLRPEPPMHVMFFLMSTVALPLLLFTGINAGRFLPAQIAREVQRLTTDPAAAELRLDWALRGLAPEEA